MNLYDMLEAIDRRVHKDPAYVELTINVEDIYKQIESGRALRPSSIRWIQSTFEAMKEML